MLNANTNPTLALSEWTAALAFRFLIYKVVTEGLNGKLKEESCAKFRKLKAPKDPFLLDFQSSCTTKEKLSDVYLPLSLDVFEADGL